MGTSCDVCGRERSTAVGGCNVYEDPDWATCYRLGYRRRTALLEQAREGLREALHQIALSAPYQAAVLRTTLAALDAELGKQEANVKRTDPPNPPEAQAKAGGGETNRASPPDTLTADVLAQLEALDRAASAGWHFEETWGPNDGRPYCAIDSGGPDGGHVGNVFWSHDARLIVETRRVLPALLRLARDGMALREAGKAVLDSYEAYALARMPADERSEYDEFMAPRWDALRAALRAQPPPTPEGT